MCVHILAHCCMHTYILCKYQYLLHYSELHRIHRSYMCKYYFQITRYDLLIFTIPMAMKIQLFIFHFIFFTKHTFQFWSLAKFDARWHRAINVPNIKSLLTRYVHV